uniref:Restriction endonuclease subunit S n=1 Tax=Chromohalobacter beijerinckii TaxID=86179 RepID=A0ABV8XF33_9GAMM|nr:restriction endonuclease subunit S [Chromohalobacter beijerinckii]MCK0764756.1 restriction endonuclease subunit S [Chromohalobacter beijerinckii]
MTFPKYPEYKDSGVEWLGEVPAHWEIKPLKYVATYNDEVLPESTPDDYPIKYVEISDVDDQLGITGWSEHSFSSAPSRARRVLKNGDVLISTVRTYLRAIAPVIEPPENLVGSTGFAAIRPVLGVYHFALLGYTLRAEWFISHIIARSVGVSYPAINASDLAALPLPVPPWKEQQSIAAFLDHETARIDALVKEQQRLIELLKDKRQAVISHAVTKGLDPDAPMKDSGVEWLGEVPAHWGIVKFLRCVKIAEGQVDPKLEEYREKILIAPNHVESATGRVLSLETAESQGAESGKYVCRAGDVAYSKIRPALRKACVVDKEVLCSADMYPLRPLINLTSDYLLWSILSEPFSRLTALESERVAMPKINRESLNEIYMAVPPLEEQASISDHISQETQRLDQLTSIATEAIELLSERRSALISAAVTGKIDVRGWKAEKHSEQPEVLMAAEERATYA